jgi:uncharacterized protein YeaO (DUF488 family)
VRRKTNNGLIFLITNEGVKKMIKLARIGYQAQDGEVVVDITVKNNPNHVLAPTWGLVRDLQRGVISWDVYKKAYMDLLRKRWKNGRQEEFVRLAQESIGIVMVLVCFCQDETRCHRSLAKKALEKVRDRYLIA